MGGAVVYVVLTWGGGPLGVFSTRELADAWADQYGGRTETEEWALDSEVTPPVMVGAMKLEQMRAGVDRRMRR